MVRPLTFRLVLSNTTRKSYPETFQSIFESSPTAILKIKRALFYEPGAVCDQISWQTGSPKLIPVGECFIDQEPPTSDLLWENLTNNITLTQRVSVVTYKDDRKQEKNKMKWKEVISTLLKEIGRPAEKHSEFSSIFDLPLRADFLLALPDYLGRNITTPELAAIHAANIGFVNQVVEFHINTGYAGLTAVAGDCEKIWLIAPPVPENFELLSGKDMSLLFLVEHLTDLAIFRQTAAHVMFLPPGVIHATFTVKTGILYGTNFRTRQNIFGATVGLLHSMAEGVDGGEERDNIIGTWIDVMRDIAKEGTRREKTEASYSFRMLRELWQAGAFQNWTEGLEQLAKDCYPAAKLHKKKKTRDS